MRHNFKVFHHLPADSECFLPKECTDGKKNKKKKLVPTGVNGNVARFANTVGIIHKLVTVFAFAPATMTIYYWHKHPDTLPATNSNPIPG